MVSMFVILNFDASSKKFWEEFLVGFILLVFLYTFSYVFKKKKK